MYCRNCGFEVKGSSKFCAHCGNAITRNQSASGNTINRNHAAKINIKMPSARTVKWAAAGIVVLLGIIIIAVSNNNKRSYTPYTQNESITQQQTQPQQNTPQTQSQPVAENPPAPANNYDPSYNPYAPYGMSNDFLSGDVFGNPYQVDPYYQNLFDLQSSLQSPSGSNSGSGSSGGNTGGPRSICTYCNGTGQILAGWSTDYTGTSVRTWCVICNESRYPHYHKTCTSCNGTRFQ